MTARTKIVTPSKSTAPLAGVGALSAPQPPSPLTTARAPHRRPQEKTGRNLARPRYERQLTAREMEQAIREQSEFAAKRLSPNLKPQPPFTPAPGPAAAAILALPELHDEDFMHGEISRLDAEARLKAFQIGVGGDSGGVDRGCWLVRRKSRNGQLFALSVLGPGSGAKATHYRLQRHTAGSSSGSGYFSVQGSSGTPVRLMICTSPLEVVTVLRSCSLTSARITGIEAAMLAGSTPVPESRQEVANLVSG